MDTTQSSSGRPGASAAASLAWGLRMSGAEIFRERLPSTDHMSRGCLAPAAVTVAGILQSTSGSGRDRLEPELVALYLGVRPFSCHGSVQVLRPVRDHQDPYWTEVAHSGMLLR